MKKVKFTVPQSWAQVSSEQLKQYARLQLLEVEADTRLAMVAINWAGYRIKLDKNAFKHEDIVVMNNDKEFRLQTHQVLALIEAVRWTSEEIIGIKPPALKFKPPNAQIYGTTLQQFLIADGAYIAYSVRQDPKMLKILAAVYYGSFNPKIIKTKVNTMHLKPYELMAVYLWFTSVKKFMMKKYSYLYPESDDTKVKNINMKEVALDILANLNNGNIGENPKLMKKGEIHAAFRKMNHDAKQAALYRGNGRS